MSTTAIAVIALQDLNRDPGPMAFWECTQQEICPIEWIVDAEGRPLEPVTTQADGLINYHCMFQEPLSPGTPMMIKVHMRPVNMIQRAGDGLRTFHEDMATNASWPMRVVGLFRLPAGASEVSATPSMTQRLVDGRVQLYAVIPLPVGSNPGVTIRYRLP